MHNVLYPCPISVHTYSLYFQCLDTCINPSSWWPWRGASTLQYIQILYNTITMYTIGLCEWFAPVSYITLSRPSVWEPRGEGAFSPHAQNFADGKMESLATGLHWIRQGGNIPFPAPSPIPPRPLSTLFWLKCCYTCVERHIVCSLNKYSSVQYRAVHYSVVQHNQV
jgi:hypothetical protein